MQAGSDRERGGAARCGAAGDVIVLTGRLRWVGRDGRRAVLRVDADRDGRGAAAQQVVTLALDAAEVHAADRDGDGRRTGADLRAGEHVTLRTRVARGRRLLPDLVPVSTLTAHGTFR